MAREFSRRSMREDALKHILKAEAGGRFATREGVAGALHITTGAAVRLLGELEEKGLLTFDGGKLRLRPAGRDLGLHVVRAHRLWESYLADATGVAEAKWHEQAEKQEHLLSPEAAEALAARLGHPTHDPHGDAIPGKGQPVEPGEARSLNSIDPEVPAVITHIEDEPEAVYRQLIAQGLHPGIKAFVIEMSPARVRLWADGRAIKPLPGVNISDLVEEEHLSMLKEDETARVVGLSAACRGMERRRLLDLGFVPGSKVEVEMVSPSGDPTAYRVRDTIIALRREQADLIRIQSRHPIAA
jgi:DtxR family Mn-dependent transcriptional regulator